jgi:hypothetical protein
VLCVF